jgi:UDP:flavonoid glycosyltransferase YjiC (YdhE family)
MRIVFTTWGSLGDIHPYLALAIELKQRGHQPVIATLPAFRPNVEAAGVGFAPLRPDIDATDRQAFDAIVRRLLDEKVGPRVLFLEIFAPNMRETYEDTLAAVTGGGGADLLVTHQVPVTGPIVAEATQVKWVSSVLLPMAFLSDFDPPTPPQAPWLQSIASTHRLVGRALNRLGRRVTERWVEPVYRFREELGLPRGGNPVFEGQHSPRMVLGLFSPFLARLQPDFPTNTIITGFSFYDAAEVRPLPPKLEDFLDHGEPPIVFTLGSSAVWIAEDFWEVSLEAVRRLGRRALLLVGEEHPLLEATWPRGVAAFAYAPHGRVMPRASVVVHQGGVGTTGQALRSGRPMLVVPYGQDQPDNARRCRDLGVARSVPRRHYTIDRVTRELSALLNDRAYAERAAFVGRGVQDEQGTTRACDAIERVLREGGPPPHQP